MKKPCISNVKRPQLALADEVCFSNHQLILLGGGNPLQPCYELAEHGTGRMVYLPSGSVQSRLIVQQIEAWKQEELAPTEAEVVEFLAAFLQLGAVRLCIQ